MRVDIDNIPSSKTTHGCILHGWSMYEGPFCFKNASADDSADPIFPVLGYNHSSANKKVGSAAISGGIV
ncbi:hypothetical protein RND71_014327 [Anisodus tanguticus]|uniref:Uncharacterized protein n=1 Tax=Anisodus tanguticus TaxID=243964 RepID=A0AAE1SB43_9SOLA|nr:hypothetical protein RND71_014327 [Anisodus tanguticus]